MKIKNDVIVITEDSEYMPFYSVMKLKRIERGMSMSDLGIEIGKSSMQIQRYESSDEKWRQYPTLEVFRRICLALQVDANEFLGLNKTFSDKGKRKVVGDTIYEWFIRGFALEEIIKKHLMSNKAVIWICPACSKENISYINFKDKADILNMKFQCEHDECGNCFEKLFGVEKLELKKK